MAFGVTGFGAVQLTPSPQIFQALSLGGKPPVAPAPPYGTVDPTALVPVYRTSSPPPALPANLTLAAHATFQAILKVNQTVVTTGQFPLPQQQTFTKTALGATVPTLNAQTVAPVPPSIPPVGNPPLGVISFALTAAPASVGSASTLVSNTAALLQAGLKQFQTPLAHLGGTTGQTAGVASPPVGGNDPSLGASDPPAPVHGSGGTAPSTPSPAPAGAVAQIVATVKSLAIGAVYPAPVFSFSA